MKFHILSALILGFMCLFSGASAKAQTINQVSFKTDFDFYVEGKKFEAGEYVISSLRPSLDGSVYQVRRKDSKAQTLFKVMRNDSYNYRGKNEYVFKFNRYGNDYFLASIENDLLAYKVLLSRSKKEVEIAKNYVEKDKRQIAIAIEK